VNIHFLAPDLAMTDFPAIDESHLKDMTKVAEGGFGIVYRALINEVTVAVKELKVNEAEADSADDALAEFQIEVYIMSCLRHPCLVGLYGICVNPLRMVIGPP
jgi:serine/threonine protein kinase